MRLPILLILPLVLGGCGSQPQTSTSIGAASIAQISGTWTLANGSCSNTPIVFGDMQETFTVSGSTASIQDVSLNSNCQLNAGAINLIQDGASIRTSGGSGVICSIPGGAPTPSCVIPLNINGISVNYTCPQNFPVLLTGIVSTYTATAHTLQRTVNTGDQICVYNYTK